VKEHFKMPSDKKFCQKVTVTVHEQMPTSSVK